MTTPMYGSICREILGTCLASQGASLHEILEFAHSKDPADPECPIPFNYLPGFAAGTNPFAF
jgi:hypothetical protein